MSSARAEFWRIQLHAKTNRRTATQRAARIALDENPRRRYGVIGLSRTSVLVTVLASAILRKRGHDLTTLELELV
jgi:hypothetical protein